MAGAATLSRFPGRTEAMARMAAMAATPTPTPPPAEVQRSGRSRLVATRDLSAKVVEPSRRVRTEKPAHRLVTAGTRRPLVESRMTSTMKARSSDKKDSSLRPGAKG